MVEGKVFFVGMVAVEGGLRLDIRWEWVSRECPSLRRVSAISSRRELQVARHRGGFDRS